MHLRRAIALFAVLGMVGFTATIAQAGPGGCCSAKGKATAAGSGSCTAKGASSHAGCGASMKASKDGGCSAHASSACTMSAKDCEKMLRAYYQKHGWLGIESNGCPGMSAQPTIIKVAVGSPAEAAGFKVGDVLTSVNGIGYGDENDATIQSLMQNGFKVGDPVHYTAMREGKIVNLDAKLVKINDAALNDMIATHIASAHPAGDKAEKSM